MQYSKVIQTGTVGRPPNSGGSGFRAWAAFSFAIDSEKKDDPTLWVDVICFGKQAEVVRSYVSTGSRVMVEGCSKVKLNNGVVCWSIKASDIRLIKTPHREKDEKKDGTGSKEIDSAHADHSGNQVALHVDVSGEPTPSGEDV